MQRPSSLLSLLALSLLACGPTTPTNDASPDVATDVTSDVAADSAAPDAAAPDAAIPMDAAITPDAATPEDAASTPDAAPDSPAVTCSSTPAVVMVPAEITADTTWDCNSVYRITQLTYVRSPAVLTISPGTRIEGLGMPSGLVITRGAKINAQGTAAQPVVFTSARAVGSRVSGDWGGVVLLGGARINVPAGTENIEGIDASETRANYGGTDDTHDCGTIRYARIEFAGQLLSVGNELNGLTLGGCGNRTTIDYVQVHLGADDAVEIFGGTVDVKHIVATQFDDDGLDWDFGWTGRGQYIIAQSPMNSGETDPRNIEADSNRTMNGALPLSNPTLYNVTLVGQSGNAVINSQPAVVLRRGTGVRMANSLIVGRTFGAVDVHDAASSALANMTPPLLTIDSSIFFGNGGGPTMQFNDLSGTTDGDFNEQTFFSNAARMNRFDANPMLPAAATSATAPSFVPPAGSPAATGAATPPAGGFFDTTATFIGALRPGAADWTAGWTAYPTN